MSEEPKPKSRYMPWPESTPEEVALSRKLFFGMMAALAVLLVSLAYGALR